MADPTDAPAPPPSDPPATAPPATDAAAAPPAERTAATPAAPPPKSGVSPLIWITALAALLILGGAWAFFRYGQSWESESFTVPQVEPTAQELEGPGGPADDDEDL